MTGPVEQPTDVLLGLRTSTADLLLDLDGRHWTDADVSAETLLPDWSRGHLLTHLARNADSVASTLAGTLRGEIVAQYPGGREQRAADIAAGAHRPMAVLLADVRASAEKLDVVLGALDEASAWDDKAGDGLTASEWLPKRWLEVEVHRVDLDCGYAPDGWPALFVATWLPAIAASLPDRTQQPVRVTVDPAGSVSGTGGSWGTDGVEVTAPDWALLAWLLGRSSPRDSQFGAAPALDRWH